MSDALRPIGSGEVTAFEPRQTFGKLAQLDADILKWRKLKDWPALEAAVDAKIAEQAEFVAWWDGDVQRPGGDRTIVAAVGQWSVADAEAQTGISKQTVSRWRIGLHHRTAYRKRIIAGSYRVALEPRTRPDPPDPVDFDADNCTLLQRRDVAALLEHEPDSVDWIVTDPPYPREYLPLYDDLARGAAHVLGVRYGTGRSWLRRRMRRLPSSPGSSSGGTPGRDSYCV